jgi:hypothetical protein
MAVACPQAGLILALGKGLAAPRAAKKAHDARLNVADENGRDIG